MLVVRGEGDLLGGEVDLADAALEAGRVVHVPVAADDLPLHLLVALLAVHVLAVQLLKIIIDTVFLFVVMASH